ncbi:MAG: mechanosensitive ion channel domain-containing protein [Alphaproteobacteria bacterium]
MKKICLSFLLVFFFSCNAFSQTPSIVAPVPVSYTKITKELEVLETSLKKGSVTTEQSVIDIQQLNETRTLISVDKKAIEQDLSFVQKRIEALGEAPTDGTTEPYSIVQKRKEVKEESSKLKSKIAEADVVLAKIDELDNMILNLRNQELLGSILDKKGPLIYPTNFMNSTIVFAEFIYDVVLSPFSWYQELSQESKFEVQKNLYKVFSAVFISLLIAVGLSLFIRKRYGYKVNNEKPDYSSKVFAAIAVFTSYGVIPSTIIGGFILWMKQFGIVDNGLFTISLYYALLYSLFAFLAQAIVRVLFVPENSKWRLIEVRSKKARSLSRAMLFSIIMICIVSFLEMVAEEAKLSVELENYLSMLSSAVKAFSIIIVSHRFAGDSLLPSPTEEDEGDAEIETTAASQIILLLSLFVVGAFSLSLFGYVNLAEFIFNRLILSAITLITFYILNKAIREIFCRIFTLRFWNRSFGIGRKTLSKMNFWLGLLLTPVMAFLCVMIVLGLWGVSVDLLLNNIKRFLTEFYVGGIKVSIISIAFGIFVFFASLYIFKLLKRHILNNVLSKTDIDDGIKNSLSSGFGFIGFVSSALFAISVMGGSMGNLALIAGALSFGVGLGFQNIVSNLVSGIIILFERPFKIGDWVIIGGQEGIVKQINIRATEIETFDKSSVIIPNGTILSSSLINRTHHNKTARVDIAVGVAYGSDIKKVKEILLDIAKTQDFVLKTPEPFVTFAELGASSLDFVVRCYTADVSNKGLISNEIREKIVERFDAENIDIPFPQMVVHKAK